MFKAELHSHTIVSDGSMKPEHLVKLVRKKGCKILAVTDHDSFEGSIRAFKAKNLYSINDLLIIFSAEIRTTWGDILIYCPSMPEGEAPKDPFDLKEWSDENSCILVPAHPLHPFRHSIGYKKLIEGKDLWNAVEVWNSRGLAIINYITLNVAKKLALPFTSGSDAHVPSEVCTSFTAIFSEDFNLDSIIESIKKGKTRPFFNIESVKARIDSLAWSLERRVLPSSY